MTFYLIRAYLYNYLYSPVDMDYIFYLQGVTIKQQDGFRQYTV